ADRDVDNHDEGRRSVGELRCQMRPYLDVPLGVGHDRERRSRSVSAVDSAAAAAWAPLSSAESGSPARSSACCSLSTVSTPLATGVRASRDTLVRPWVTASQ